MRLNLQISMSFCLFPKGKGKCTALSQRESADYVPKITCRTKASISNFITALSGIKVLLLMLALLTGGIRSGHAQPLTDIGLYLSGTDTLEVRLIPRGFFNGVASNVVFTIRWESGCGSSLGNIIQTGLPASYLPVVKSGTPKNTNGYTYQVFGGTGFQALSTIATSWTNGVPVTLLKLPVNNSRGTFEIVNDSWTSTVTNNADFFVSLNGQKKTGSIYQGSYSFINSGFVSICTGDSVLIGGKYRKLPGTYYDTLQGAGGCDSIVLATLTIANASSTNRSATLCQGQSYFAGGAWQTTSGVYYDYFSTGTGCDSVIITTLTVNAGYSVTQAVNICQGQSYFAGGANRTTNGTYFDHYTSANGCDSTIITQLTVHPNYVRNVYMYLCAGQTAIAGGNYQTETGIYYDTLNSRFGCDSVIVTHLTVDQTIHYPNDITVCNGDGFFAGGGFQTASGTYYDTLTASFGCDSIAITNLTVLPSLNSSHPVSICSGESYYAGGMWRSASGSYSDVLVSSQGCDSVVTTILTVLPKFASSRSVQICSDEQFYAGGAFQNSSGVYRDTFTARNGCDSVATTILNVKPISVSNIEIFICSDESYYVAGALQTTSGKYYDTLVAANGCDSIVLTDLTIFPVKMTNVTAAICDGESYLAGGSPRTVQGTYYDTATAQNGCDSIVITQLSVFSVKSVNVNAAICSGESFFAGGALRTLSGTYYDTLATAHGCDSVVITQLTVYPVYLIPVSAFVCAGEGMILGGIYRTQSGVYYDTLATVNGCDSIVVTELTVNPPVYYNRNISACRGESVFVGGGNQITNGTYYDTLIAANGCDSVVITNLTFIETDTTSKDILILSGSNYYAGGAWQNSSGVYYDTLVSQHGCDSIIKTTLSVENIFSDLVVNTVKNTLTIRTALEKDYADNTYGANAIGWGISRTLDSLITSDHLQWAMYDASGQKKLDFSVDYFSGSLESPSGYKSLGVSGGDGHVLVGSDSNILNTTTSINENFNTLGYVLTQNSPSTDTNYTPDPAYPDWIYEVWYEATVDLSVFGATGYGYHDIVAAHASPDKDDVDYFNEPDSIVSPGCPRSETARIIICEGDSYFVGGAFQTLPGIYYDTLTVNGNCDIIVVSTIIVLPTPITEIFASICPGGSYLAGGILRQTAGTYYDTLTAATGCDSIIKTNLSVLPAPTTDLFVSICQGESYFAGGALRTTTGIYTDLLVAANGCDSTVITHLTVRPNYLRNRYVSICEGDSLLVGGAYQNSSGIYTDSLTAATGCDSVVITTLAVQLTVVEINEISICEGDSFFAGGDFQTATGNYYDTLQGAQCDSVIITSLIVIGPVTNIIQVSICSNESYFAEGANQTLSGVYHDTVSAINGCDSIVTTLLNVLPVYSTNESVSICTGDSIYAEGGYQHSSGSYTDVFSATNGCDSIVTTTLIVLPTQLDTVAVAICSGESFFAGGAAQTMSGVYYDTFLNADGCDSVTITLLTVNPNYSVMREIFICENESFFAEGAWRSTAGVYRDTLTSSEGCDSIIITDLKINKTNLKKADVFICDGDSIFVGGGYRTSAGIYYDTLFNRFGCDSVIRTNLKVESHIQVSFDTLICAGDSFFAGGIYQHSAGTFYDTMIALGGCDSIVVTTLTIGAISIDSNTVVLCAGDSIYAGSGYQNSSGIYVDTLSSMSGCDSIVVTALSILPPISETVQVSICPGATYFAGGAFQNSSGTYFDTLRATDGCDSIVITVLTMKPAFTFTQEISICENESFFAGGALRNVEGVYYDTLVSAEGCDSILITNLEINPTNLKKVDANICDGDSFFVGGAYQTIPGIYYDTIPNRFGCDSIIRTKLSAGLAIQISLDVELCEGDSTYAGGAYQNSSGVYRDTLAASFGCDSILITNISILETAIENISVQICSGDSVYAGGSYTYQTGIYFDTLARASGCDSIVITDVSVIPPDTDTSYLTICDNQSVFVNGEWINTGGTYLDTLSSANGCDSLVVVVVNVVSTFHTSTNVFICTGDSYYAGGAFQTTNGTYRDTFLSVTGCDSIATTILKVKQHQSAYSPVSICTGQSYFAGGQYRTVPGIYLDTFYNSFGCDSIVLTILNVRPSLTKTVNVEICDNELYFAGGAYRNTPGVYRDTFSTATGCDSIVSTILNVNESFLINRGVSICSGDSVFLQGQFRANSGLFYDTLVARNMCDSIIATTLIVKNQSFFSRNITICEGENFFAGGADQNSPGIYYDTLTADNGCDSVVTTELIIIPAQLTPVWVEICEGDSYMTGGELQNTAGIYYDTLLNVYNCDSVIQTELAIIPSKHSSVDVAICEGESFFAGNVDQTESGIYHDTLAALNGCDSIVSTHLEVLPQYSAVVLVSICASETYLAGGSYRNTEGIYYDTLTTDNGCDSVVVTLLEVFPVYDQVVTVTICAYESYYAGGGYQNTSGIYIDTFYSDSGCDSVVTTELIVLPDFTTMNPVSVCEGSGYFAQGAFRTISGTYYDTLVAPNGCYHIIITQLEILPDKRTDLDVSICFGEEYFAQGNWQASPGEYYDTFFAANGCDSIVVTNLMVLPQNYHTVDVEICSDESYFAQGELRNTSGLYGDFFLAENGCDSIVITNLDVLPVSFHSINAVICSGEYYQAGGELQGAAGTYYDTLTAFNGCDSVVTTTLTVLPVRVANHSQTICTGDSFYVAGAFQTAPGIYYDTTQATNGCDSIIVTTLYLLPIPVTNIDVAICESETYYTGGENQSVPGTYYDTLSASNGCDSIIITTLSILPNRAANINVAICEGETYYAGGENQSSSGVYYDTLLAANGCDSITITNLTVNSLSSHALSVSICAGDSYYAGGAQQTQPGTYYDHLINSNGCDSVVITNLQVLLPVYKSNAVSICAGDSVFLGGTYQHLPGSYRDTLVAANGCDSIVKTQLIVKPAYVVNRYFTICSNESIFIGGGNHSSSGTYYDSLTALNGCDSVVVSYLTVIPTRSSFYSYDVCEGEEMFIAGAYRTTSGIYYDTLIADNGCDSVVATTLQVNPNPIADAGSDETICHGETTTLAATGGDFYLWSTSETTPSISITPSDTISLSVSVTNSFGCSDTDTVTINVNPLLFASFSGLDSAYCTNDEDDVLTGIPAGGSFSGPGVAGNLFSPSGLSSGYHTITYQYTDSLGCQANSSRTVGIKTAAQASFTGLSGSYCSNAPPQLLMGSPTGGIFSGTGISSNSFNPGNAGAGNHEISYTYTTSEGCVSLMLQYVEVLSVPQISFHINDSVLCISENPLLLHATPDSGQYSGAGVTDSLFYPAAAGAGFHAITYTSAAANGCSSAVSRTIQVRNNPQAHIGRLAAGYCINRGEVTLSASPSGGLFLGNGVSGKTFNTMDAGPGEHDISYLYVDQFYCAATDTVTISVYASPQAEISGLNEEYCVNAAPVFASGSPPGGIFSGQGMVVNVFDAGIAGVGGPFPVTYRFANMHGCAAVDTQWVTVNPLPVLNLDLHDFTYCLNGSTIELNVVPEGGLFLGPGISGNRFNPSLAGLGIHNIIYSYADSNQCSSNLTVTVLVEICSGITEISSGDWRVYPNPFSNRINLQSDSDNSSELKVRLTNILGQTIYRQTLPLHPGTNTISLQSLEWLPDGIYHIEILSGDKMYVKKLVKAN